MLGTFDVHSVHKSLISRQRSCLIHAINTLLIVVSDREYLFECVKFEGIVKELVLILSEYLDMHGNEMRGYRELFGGWDTGVWSIDGKKTKSTFYRVIFLLDENENDELSLSILIVLRNISFHSDNHQFLSTQPFFVRSLISLFTLSRKNQFRVLEFRKAGLAILTNLASNIIFPNSEGVREVVGVLMDFVGERDMYYTSLALECVVRLFITPENRGFLEGDMKDLAVSMVKGLMGLLPEGVVDHMNPPGFDELCVWEFAMLG